MAIPVRRAHFLPSPLSAAFTIVRWISDFAQDLRPAMSSSPPIPSRHEPDLPPDASLPELQAKLQRLERRDWWLWSMAVVVMLLLTFAVFSMTFPGLVKVDDPFFQSSLNRAVRGLIGLVLIFNAYTIYQQVTVKRLRRDFSRKIEEMRILQVRAGEFERLALVDSLTGLSNRRVAEGRLASEAARSARYGHPLTVISFDLDKFKQINDTYGHLAGDQVLKQFAHRLGSTIRKSDLAARMGGDEFLVLLPECTTNQVQMLLDRLRPMETEYGGAKIPICFSAGWVGYEKGETTEQFLERADRTLYAEKRAGKTREKEPVAVR
jgi:diguanylate cyclase (GGDEF)-like protein